MRMIIENGYIIDKEGNPVLSRIYMENGIIYDIGKDIEQAQCPVIDAEGGFIIPGLIDMNCDICDPGYENKEDLVSVSRSAAKGGFTSITCSPMTNPVVDNKTVVNYIISKSRKQSPVNTYIYGSMTVGCNGEKIAEIGEMVRAGIVALSDGGKSITDSALLRNIMLYSKMFNIPVITLCEDKYLANKGVVNAGKIATAYGLKGLPREAEEVIIARNLIICEYTGCHLHISSVSTAGSVALIRTAKAKGVNVTCETQPHYFTLTEDCVKGYNTFAKVKPPLRTDEDVDAIKGAVADGTIDVISTGHSPDTLESKNVEFDVASYGISSLETAFSISYEVLVKSGLITMGELVNKFSLMPAQILGLEGKGEIKEGYDADIVIFKCAQSYAINPATFASKAKYSPFEDCSVSGKVLYTIVGGDIVYLN